MRGAGGQVREVSAEKGPGREFRSEIEVLQVGRRKGLVESFVLRLRFYRWGGIGH